MELTIEDKKVILTNRIKKLLEDGYQFELNYKFAVNQKNEEAVKKYKDARDATLAALDFHKKELAALEA